jgi:hypothetical protein
MTNAVRDYPLLASPHIRLSGTVDEAMYASLPVFAINSRPCRPTGWWSLR